MYFCSYMATWYLSLFVVRFCGLFIMHGKGTGTGTERDQLGAVEPVCCTEMFTLMHDRERKHDPSFPIVLVQFSVPVPVSFPSCVNKPLLPVRRDWVTNLMMPCFADLNHGEVVEFFGYVLLPRKELCPCEGDLIVFGPFHLFRIILSIQ